jgi:hypothetical protein
MPLPKKPNVPVTDPMQYTTLIYGGPKIGKTTWASNAPGALFIATEPGTKALPVYDVRVDDWMGLLKALGDLATTKHSFKTVVVDTVDNAYVFCSAHVCNERGWRDPSEAGANTNGYNAVNNEFRRVLLKLIGLGMGVVFISHSKEVQVKTRTGSYDRITTSLPGTAAKIVKGAVDVMMYVDLEPTDKEDEFRHVLRTRPTPTYDAGGRFPGLPETIPLDYDAYTKAFKQAVLAAKGDKTK